MSTTISPVTQMDDVDVKAAVRNDAPPGPAVATGSMSRPVPTRMRHGEGQRDELRRVELEAPTHASTVASGARLRG